MIVVDAGAWATALVDDGPLGDVTRRVLEEERSWAGPAHLPIEVLRTVRRYERAGLISRKRAGDCVEAVADAEVRYGPPSRWLLGEVWRLRHNLNAYDAAYVALARYHDSPLVTFDKRLARAARSTGAEVTVPN